MSIAAMKQAVEYLRLARDYGIALGVGNSTIDDAIRDLLNAVSEQEKCEPEAWAIYISGEPSDVFIYEQFAKLECARRDKLYPDATRKFIPLFTHPAPVHAGMVLVPVEPTEEMKVAGSDALGVYHCGSPSDIYKAMLQAAPKPGESHD